jgi:histidinol phosphatase-like PHP family hydrolase
VPEFQPVDLHAHTTMSDGVLSAADLVATVTARGVQPSVADHLSRDVASSVKSVDGVRAYLDELDRYPGLLRGGEFCWHDSLWRELPDDVVRRFTHRIGSLHAIYLTPGRERYLHMFQRRLPEGLTPQTYMDAHVAELERFAAEMPVDVLAHPTLLPVPYRTLPLEDLWTEPREERAVDALYRAGIAFEVSNRYRPHERFVHRAAARGVRLSLGSDGHTPEQVGNVAWPLALTRSLGVRDDALYDPRVHGARG